MYDQHYGLTDRPFQLTPDARFWFDTATHKKAMAYLGYGLSQGEGFIVISGDVGAGKTTLVGHLTGTIDADRLNVIKIVSTQIAADDLLRTVCAGLDVDATGLSKAAMLSAIERGLHAVARGGRRTLLIVDEAQALPVDSLEELRMLSNFQAGGHAMLQIFLLGQPEFREKLADAALEQLRQRVIAMHHLGPMEPDELEPYLIHRLSVAGWTGTPRFKTDALATIYAWTGGIPRRVNVLMSRVLLAGAMEGIETFTAADIDAVAADLADDGMRGVTERPSEPELALTAEFAEPTPAPRPIMAEVAEEDAQATPIAAEIAEEQDAGPVAAEAEEAIVANDPMEGEPVEDVPEAVDADEAVEEIEEPVAIDEPVAEPIAAHEPEPEAADVEPALPPQGDTEEDLPPMRPAQISAPPRLFDRVRLLGRRPMLSTVDPAPVPEHEATTETPVADGEPPAVLEWPLRESAASYTLADVPVNDTPEPQAELAPAPTNVADLDLMRRLSTIDKRMEEQDEALRRVLTLLVDWIEKDSSRGDVAERHGTLG